LSLLVTRLIYTFSPFDSCSYFYICLEMAFFFLHSANTIELNLPGPTLCFSPDFVQTMQAVSLSFIHRF
jgi:hypothetical protein